MGALEGKVAVVTGGASGIGRGVVERFVAEGARVFVGDTNGEGIAALVAELGHNAVDGITMDVRQEGDVERLMDRCVRRFGRLDVAVNSAGIGGFSPLVDCDLDTWRAVLDVNLTGTFLCLKHEARVMRSQGRGGSIINIASLNAVQPAEGLGAYCAAKAGVAMVTKVAALEFGRDRIRVNAIAPGLIRTPLTEPLRAAPGVEQAFLEEMALPRVGEPADVAALAVFLACDESSWLTGETILLDGGAHLRRYPSLFRLLQPPAG